MKDDATAISVIRDQMMKYRLPEPSDDVWLMGGAVRDALSGAHIKDFDYIADDEAETLKAFSSWVGRGPDRESESAYTWLVPDVTIMGGFHEIKEVQLLKRSEHGGLVGQLVTTDLTCCHVAYNGERIGSFSGARKSISNKELILASDIDCPKHTAARIFKFISRGWSLSRHEAEKMEAVLQGTYQVGDS